MTKASRQATVLPLHRLGITWPVRAGDSTGSDVPSSCITIQLSDVIATLLTLVVVVVLSVTHPAAANAYATLGPPTNYSTASGLPDGRVYEQVSPTNKNGNQAGAGTNGLLANEHYAFAAGDGNSVLFEGTGAMGETYAGYNLFFVAERTATGWATRSALPRLQQSTGSLHGTLNVQPRYLDPSSDLTHVMFQTRGGSFGPPPAGCEQGGITKNQIYLSDLDSALTTTWLEQPEIENPIQNCAIYGESGAPVGGTSDFSTVYFTYPGTLLPEDNTRAPHAVPLEGEGDGVEAWGFYENRDGVLREAGVLPDGSLDQFGAVPAASGHGRAISGNQVSADGSRAFFVSPDPASCKGANNCVVDPPELYVRENGERTLLVSRSTLLPEAEGLPASAPGGVLQMPNPTVSAGGAPGVDGSYVFASPDGTQAFFQSADALTQSADDASPGTEPKTYDFDVDTGAVTYLPNVSGEILATDGNGSTMAFIRPQTGSAPAELDLWRAGPGGGSITAITQLSGAVLTTRMSTDGSVTVFTSASVPGTFNSGGFDQVYRYDSETEALTCVSCPPVGVTPTGKAVMSALQNAEGAYSYTGLVDERGLATDASRIFFDSPDALVPQDVDGTRDVYEWENGTVYLISSGSSIRNSYFLDNSESGGDVFFATTAPLSEGDTDNGYDVYDARIPHPGDNPPATSTPCQGSVCQGPPAVPVPFGAPSSATFSGLGNVTSPSTAIAPKPVTTRKSIKCKRGSIRKKNRCVKRSVKKSRKTKVNRRGK